MELSLFLHFLLTKLSTQACFYAVNSAESDTNLTKHTFGFEQYCHFCHSFFINAHDPIQIKQWYFRNGIEITMYQFGITKIVGTMKKDIIKLVGIKQRFLHENHFERWITNSSYLVLIFQALKPNKLIFIGRQATTLLMSRLRQTKKLHPAKKAWRSFSNTLQSKIHKLNIPRAIKTTIRRLVSSLHSLASLIPSNSKARRPLTRRYSTSYCQVQRKNFAVRIDDLYAEPANNVNVYTNMSHHARGETSRVKGKEVICEKESPGENSQIDTIEDAWKVVVARSPQLQVDEKAEEFINKFHQDMRLQKEMSLLEFQERLKRSA